MTKEEADRLRELFQRSIKDMPMHTKKKVVWLDHGVFADEEQIDKALREAQAEVDARDAAIAASIPPGYYPEPEDRPAPSPLVTCEACKGTGGDERGTCPRCRGAGSVKRENDAYRWDPVYDSRQRPEHERLSHRETFGHPEIDIVADPHMPENRGVMIMPDGTRVPVSFDLGVDLGKDSAALTVVGDDGKVLAVHEFSSFPIHDEEDEDDP